MRRFQEREPRWSRGADGTVLAWAARSYPPGHVELDDDSPVPPPPVPAGDVLHTVERLRRLAAERGRRARRCGIFVHA